ncbi:MAG: SpoIIE family protein phosphatase [Bacteroidota bacterium]|nr:SpoIIE family protein phosphatase [Candidatus Kapabacteria bacterium]MDW8218911.1 SpoIIE family protein phosphatase [Bacteroidota bacterium]
MLHPIFPLRKPRVEIVLWCLGGIATVLCFTAKKYWVYRPIQSSLPGRIEAVIDSVLQRNKIDPDTVRIDVQVNTDEHILSAAYRYAGAGVREYLDTAALQHRLYRITIQQRGMEFVDVNLGRTTSKRYNRMGEEKSVVRRVIWLNDHGDIVGEKRRFEDTALQLHRVMHMLRAPAPDTNGLSIELVCIRQALLRHIPQNGFAQGIHAIGEQWKLDTTVQKGVGLIATISQDKIVRREWKLHVLPALEHHNLWILDWQHRVIPNDEYRDNAQEQQIGMIVTVIFWGAVVVAVLYLCVVFLQRVRLKAIPLWSLLLAPITGFTMTASLMSIDLPWYLYVLLWIVYSVGFGLFLSAIPFAALVSLIQERFPEKFYTLRRCIDKPWQSFHVGRMIATGASVGAIYVACSVALVALAETLGWNTLVNVYAYEPMHSLPFIMRNPWLALVALSGFSTIIGMSISLAPIALAYSVLPPRRYAFGAMVIGLAVIWTLFAFVQSRQVGYSIVFGFLFAVPLSLLFYYYDVMAMLIYTGVAMVLSGLGAFAGVSWGMIVPIGVLVSIGIAGIGLVWWNAPEKVEEADYKPEFLSLIEETKRLQEEIAAAKSVQKRLLPQQLPELERVRLSAACIPAYEVGGDYYDFFLLDEQRLGVLIGDVSGKGISAAFYITLTKGVIVSQVHSGGSPSEVLHRVNALLYGVMERGKFVSMIYGIYDMVSGEFSFANAGHSPLLIVRTNGEVSPLFSKGMAIGLDRGQRFEHAVKTVSTKLLQGDCVVLYTDGVTEAMNAEHEEYGEQRMIAAIQSSSSSADAIVSAVLADVRKFVGRAHQHDDITLVVLQAHALGNVQE